MGMSVGRRFRKWLTNLALGAPGPELLDLAERERGYRKKYRTGRFARFDMDRTLEKLMDHDGGFFVELGANDGAMASNSYYFELKRNWRGVLIEPAPNLYLSCLKRRGAQSRVYCNACVGFDYSDEFVSMAYADSMTLSESLELDIGDRGEFLEASKAHLRAGEPVFRFGAKAATLTAILDDAGAPAAMDFLSLDVEGAELEVLKGFDFSRYSFRYMVIECRDIDRLSAWLEPHGYRLREKLTHHDHLFEHMPQQG